LSVDIDDPRWGGYIPWFLRNAEFCSQGDFPTFFSRLSQRLHRLFHYNECKISNPEHFGSWLESETLQRFKFNPALPLSANIILYFSPSNLEREAAGRTLLDQSEREATHAEQMVHTLARLLNPPPRRLGSVPFPEVVDRAKTEQQLTTEGIRAKTLRDDADATKANRNQHHYAVLVNERIGVLEGLLRILPHETAWRVAFIQDVLRFLAEAQIMLTIRKESGIPIQIVPIDEPILQNEVVEKLLPRLAQKYPHREKELIRAYHDLLHGKDYDSIFADAFKSLEQLARDITGDDEFIFDKSHLSKCFPLLHRTIHETLIRLAGHRGDKAGHGKDAPAAHEMRYLLFCVCNAALLVLDYPAQGKQDD
jgi:hypothetical protein